MNNSTKCADGRCPSRHSCVSYAARSQNYFLPFREESDTKCFIYEEQPTDKEVTHSK